MTISHDELVRRLIYNRKTGHFYWRRISNANRWWEGRLAGTTTRAGGYVYICIDQQYYPAHHLAWFYINKVWPEDEVDHKNVTPSDNSYDNLRPATSGEQKRNKRVQSNNRSGLKGAFYHACRKGKKWRSQIKVGSRLIFLGYFHTAEEAHAAYGVAASEHFGEFGRAA